MSVHVPRKFLPLLDRPLTESETETFKRRFFISLGVFITLLAVVVSVLLILYQNPWTVTAAILMLAYVSYRLYRRQPRRCPKCCGKDNQPSKTFFGRVRHFWKRVFGGWFFRRHYWREDITYKPIPDVDEAPLKRIEEVLRAEDPTRFPKRCVYNCVCWCSLEYQVKDPEVKSFRHRVRRFFYW